MDIIDMDDILVSIITICLNSEKTIERTIKSVLGQSYKNIEYIIIDGVSTDKTLEIVNSYAPLFDGRMRVYSEKDAGIYDAMNKGISKSRGTLIGICNSDDWLEEDAVENIVSIYNPNEPYQMLYGMVRDWYGENEACVGRVNHFALEKRKVIEHPGIFITKKIYEDHGVYDCEFNIGADYELEMREYFKYSSETKFVPTNKVISNFSLGGASYGPETHWQHSQILYKYGQMSRKEYLKEKRRYKLKKLVGK